MNSINKSFLTSILDDSLNLKNHSRHDSQNSSFANQTIVKYCQNDECQTAAISAFFIGWPVLIATSFCVITCLGFTCGGVAGASLAASCQSACYGPATGGCFSLLQSAGAGGCMGIIFVICIVSIFCSIPSIGTWYLCLYICESLNES